ncbi:ROK family protein [Clostridium sp. Ade.TY]|uniref:ROK family protein n=1 Tax=Clostridium sp. Ade.TY TaxID=1391647 RepID=UPI0004041B37|nr:ROK family protein [Clostridium sp. Ade.TY]
MNNILGKPATLKEINKSLIIKCIKSKESVTRADIVEATKISHTTVRNILNELIENEEIVSVGLDNSSGGRRAERYKINANKNCIIAATIEDKKIHYRVVNIIGEILEENSSDIKSKDDNEGIFNTFDIIFNNYNNIKYIGINVPGIVTDKGYINGLCVNDWREICLKEQIKTKYNIPCILENDLNAVAIGYYKNNKESANMIYLSFTDLGVGAGIVINGKVYKGYNGFAGEVGVIPIDDSYLNEIVLGNYNDKKYIDAIVKVLKIISSLLNPKTVVLSGEKLRYSLKDKIINEYEKQFNIKSNIMFVHNESNYGLLGITELILEKI